MTPARLRRREGELHMGAPLDFDCSNLFNHPRRFRPQAGCEIRAMIRFGAVPVAGIGSRDSRRNSVLQCVRFFRVWEDGSPVGINFPTRSLQDCHLARIWEDSPDAGARLGIGEGPLRVWHASRRSILARMIGPKGTESVCEVTQREQVPGPARGGRGIPGPWIRELRAPRAPGNRRRRFTSCCGRPNEGD